MLNLPPPAAAHTSVHRGTSNVLRVTDAPGSFQERLSKGADRAWLIMRRYVVHMLASA